MKKQFVCKQESTPLGTDIIIMQLGKCVMEGWNFIIARMTLPSSPIRYRYLQNKSIFPSRTGPGLRFPWLGVSIQVSETIPRRFGDLARRIHSSFRNEDSDFHGYHYQQTKKAVQSSRAEPDVT